jgi:hypothetical protein
MDSWKADLGFDLEYPDRTKIGLLNACGNLSGFVVGPIITWIDEKYGRKWGIRCESVVGYRGRLDLMRYSGNNGSDDSLPPVCQFTLTPY